MVEIRAEFTHLISPAGGMQEVARRCATVVACGHAGTRDPVALFLLGACFNKLPLKVFTPFLVYLLTFYVLVSSHSPTVGVARGYLCCQIFP